MAESGESPRVLFVDDEDRVIRGLRLWLRSRSSDWDIRYAEGGKEAIEWMRECAPDVVVTDICMPDIGGAEVLQRVREAHPGALRIALTGQGDQSPADRAELLAHYWFHKPCDRDRLIEAITLWLSERKTIPDLC